MANVPNQSITFYVAKKKTSRSDFVKSGLRPRKLREDSGIDGALYVKAPPAHQPRWTQFVRPILAADTLKIQTKSASAVLVLSVAERTVAVTFGHGRHLL